MKHCCLSPRRSSFATLVALAAGALRRRRNVGSEGFSQFRFVCLAIAGISLCAQLCVQAYGARKVVEPGITPVQAELMADLNARLLHVGAPVFARVTVEWTGTSCVLPKGAVLEAQVVSVAPYNKATKLSEIDLAFTRAQCAAPRMAAFDLLLAALVAPPRPMDMGVLSDPLPMNTSYSGANGQVALAAVKTMQMSGNISLKLGIDESGYNVAALPRMHMGDVSGIHGMKLSFGSGTGTTTVLSCKGHDVSLEKHTVLLLVPSQGLLPRSISESVRPGSATASAAAPTGEKRIVAVSGPEQTQAEDIDVCDPSHCNADLRAGDDIDDGKPKVSFSAGQLGYAARVHQEMHDFDRDETLAWLGPDQLLVSFNPHALIHRRSLGPSGSTERIIRAVLLDTSARRVIRSVDWELPDNNEYLWPLAGGCVLAHVGSELRVYDEGLKISERIRLDAPLAFVRVTPDGNFIVVGQVRERHSPELHARLRESLQGEPEEDVSVTVLNHEFDTIARSEARSDLIPPTLLNEGQARLLALRNGRYRVALLTWDSRSSVLAEFGSGCVPRLSSLAPDLLFLSSCNVHNGMLEYRVLNSSGKLTLKGFTNPDDLVHAAKGSGDGGMFVVKTLRSSTVRSGAPFRAASLDFGEFGVYRAADGKKLFGVHVGSPTSSLDDYAMTGDGSQLAILTRDQISIYAIASR